MSIIITVAQKLSVFHSVYECQVKPREMTTLYVEHLSNFLCIFAQVRRESGCISLLLLKLSQLPRQCCLNGPGSFGNLDSIKEIQPQCRPVNFM